MFRRRGSSNSQIFASQIFPGSGEAERQRSQLNSRKRGDDTREERVGEGMKKGEKNTERRGRNRERVDGAWCAHHVSRSAEHRK